MRVCSAATGRELAAFYSLDQGKEWLTVTPEGHFMGSPHGAAVIQWRQGTKLWPLTKFLRRFERPGLVRRALAGQAVGENPDSSLQRGDVLRSQQVRTSW